MPLLSSAEYDAMLAELGGGDTATLGGVTVPCLIGAVDAEQLGDPANGSPVEVVAGALFVTVRTGALTGLRAGAPVALRGTGYVVDRVLRARNDSLTHFAAYPS